MTISWINASCQISSPCIVLDLDQVGLVLPMDFKTPANLWNVPSIRRAQNLYLMFAKEYVNICPMDSLETTPHDLGIDDDLALRMVAEKKRGFFSNARSSVSSEFLMDYIRNCLCKSGHTMQKIGVHHNFDAGQMTIIRDFLLDYGFEHITPNIYCFRHVEEKPIEGYHPDELLVKLLPYLVVTVADYGHYRGQLSIRDPNPLP